MENRISTSFQAFADTCFARCLAHPGGATNAPYLVDFGVCSLAVRFIGQADTAFFTDALDHRAVNELPGEADLSVFVVDERTSGVRLPRPFWDWAWVDGHGTVPGLAEAGGYANYQSDDHVFTLLDFARRRALLWAADVTALPEWERSFPFRMLLHKWLENSPFALVHAGAVGLPDGGFLLAGRGGSGKSTSTLACLASPLGYAGDDFVLVHPETPFVRSLYNVAKLDADNLHRFPRWEPLVANRASMPEQKGQLFLHRHCPEKISPGFPLKAILLPRFTGQADTRVRPATAAEALKALAPSTMALLRADGRTFQKMARLVNRLPGFWLETGTDLAQIPEAALALLQTLRQ